MLKQGISASSVGIILFSSNLLSFLLQPIFATYIDKKGSKILPKAIALLTFLCIICLAGVRFIKPGMFIFTILYILCASLLDMQVPLLNSISVYYTQNSWKINYGIGRGVGALGYSIASLALGKAMEEYSVDWMPVLAIIFLVISIFISFSYPKTNQVATKEETAADKGVSLFLFFRKYKWFSISLLGITLLALVHIMTENYLIEIVGQFNGDSSHVGIALFIATIAETPAMMAFDKLYKKMGSYKILIFAGICFTLKMLFYFLAQSILAIYLVQLMQSVTYVMLSPVQLFYANESVSKADMVKGQAVITAAYSLGCSLGNLLGGVLIDLVGVKLMLFSSILCSLGGLIVLFVSVKRSLSDNKAAMDTATHI